MNKLFWLMLLYVAIGCSNRTHIIASGFEGKPLPPFTLLLMDSSTRLSSNQIPLGKPVILFYFGAFCPFSQAQMADILKNMSSLQDLQFYVFTSSSFDEMKTFYNKYHLNNYSNITIGLDDKQQFTDQFAPPGFPYTAVCHSDKKVSNVFLGTVPIDRILKASK